MRPPAALLPTRRAVLVVAGMAPLALVIAAAAPAAWIVAPALGGALLVLVLLDGLFAGSLADLRVIAPADAEVGEAVRLTVLADLWRANTRARPHAALACDPRLAPGGRITLALTPDAEVWSGTAPLVPVRRGTGAITAVWLRWTGPLGLAHRQAARALVSRAANCADASRVLRPLCVWSALMSCDACNAIPVRKTTSHANRNERQMRSYHGKFATSAQAVRL